ncbi:MAG: hypothetical protein ACREMP_02910 [Candidatus Tyrphobacter sp.]
MDTSQFTPDQLHGFAGLILSVWIVIVCIAIVARILTVWFFWRIFERAGFSGAISLINLIPIGTVVSVLILAFAQWPNGSAGSAPRTPVPTG